MFGEQSVKDACPLNEDYDINVLIAALQISGFKIETYNPKDPIDPGLGYIVNKGDLPYDKLPKNLTDEIHENMVKTWREYTSLDEYKRLPQQEQEQLETNFLLEGTKSKSLKHYVCLRKVDGGLAYKDSLDSTHMPLYKSLADYLTTKGEGENWTIYTVEKRTEQQLILINRALEIQSAIVPVDPNLQAGIDASLAAAGAQEPAQEPATPESPWSQPPPSAEDQKQKADMEVIENVTTDPIFGTKLLKKYLTLDPENQTAFIELLKIIILIKSKGLNIPIDEPPDGEKQSGATPSWQAILLDQNVIDLMKPTNPINPKLRSAETQFRSIAKLPEQAYRLGFTGLDFKNKDTKLGFLYQFVLKPDGQLDKEFIKALIGDKTPGTGIQTIKTLLAHVLGKITGATFGVNFLLGTSIGGRTRRLKRAKKGLRSRKHRVSL